MFRDIVVAVTPSRVCECAADKGIAFAQRFEANLTLVHVCGVDQGWGEMEHLIPTGETKRIKEQVEAHFAEKLKGVEKCEVQVVPGIPQNEILRLARKKNADLIIMGPHCKEYDDARSRTWGMAGSCLERVSQRARCPVMIVSHDTPYGEQAFFHILVATDFSPEVECAVAYGAQLARQYQAELHLFHVLDIESLRERPKQSDIGDLLQKIKDRMADRYAKHLKGVKGCSFDALEGQPATEILKLARKVNADLIVMAHHTTHDDPEEACLGSTVARVALNSICPTMSVNSHFDLRCALY